MLALKNDSPFDASIAVFPDLDGIDAIHVFVHATFSVAGSRVAIADRQVPVQLVDEYVGAPARSSLLRTSQLHIGKPSTDVVMIGDAWDLSGRGVPELNVELAVGPLHKVVRVFGDREWSGFSGDRISRPVPFERMPLVYERAFGGVLEVDRDGKPTRIHPRNPIGMGPARVARSSEITLRRLPNLEDPYKLIRHPSDEPEPCCFGFVLPSWDPRRAFAGTYDDAWATTRAPYLPRDFDRAFLNMASPGLVATTFLQGGEPLRVHGASPNGPIRTHLPRCNLDVVVRVAGAPHTLPMQLETVLVEPNDARFGLSYHGSLRCDKQVLQVEEIRVGLGTIDIDTRAA